MIHYYFTDVSAKPVQVTTGMFHKQQKFIKNNAVSGTFPDRQSKFILSIEELIFQ